jgi:outer membrane biosynthesis protein TonB
MINTEENNYPKAFAATGIILGVIIALCYFIVFANPPIPEEGTGGILVNYGTTDEGMGSDYMSTEEPSVAENANNTLPDKVTPTPPTNQPAQAESSDKNVVTQNSEDAPEVAANSKKPSATVATPNKNPAKPTVNQNALYKGPTNNGSGQGDGTTNTPGNQGKPEGSTLTNNYDGTGSGNGGNLSGLGSRSFVNKPTVSYTGRLIGKIVVDIRVDKNGNIISATAGARGTTLSDGPLFKKCEDAVMRSSVSAGADNQQGQVVFVFKNN